MPTARDFPETYRGLGIDIDRLGCIMLDLEPMLEGLLPPDEWGYKDDTLRFVNRFEPAKKPHVTLLYGLMESGWRNQEYVDAVLGSWDMPETVSIGSLEFFPNPGKPYVPMVFRLTDESHRAVEEAHKRLQYLPHINTFPDYKSHVTIGYLRTEYIMEAASFYNDLGMPFDLGVKGLNYGA